MGEKPRTETKSEDPLSDRTMDITPADPTAGENPRPEGLQRSARRVTAGILVEGGQADRKIARSFQDQIQEGRFNPDDAADRLLPETLSGKQQELLDSRSKSLMRDLVMAPKLKGLAGAGRSVRQKGRNLFAYIFTQLLVLVLFALFFLAAFAILRVEGTDVQGYVDRAISTIGFEPGSGQTKSGSTDSEQPNTGGR